MTDYPPCLDCHVAHGPLREGSTRAVTREHYAVAFRQCRRPLPDRVGCGGRMVWQEFAAFGLEGCCAHCGWLAYTSDILSGKSVVQPIPEAPQRRGTPRIRSGGGRGGWTSLHAGFFDKAS